MLLARGEAKGWEKPHEQKPQTDHRPHGTSPETTETGMLLAPNPAGLGKPLWLCCWAATSRWCSALLCSSALLLLLPLPSTSPKWCCPSFEGCEQEAAELPNVDSGWVSPGMGPLNQPVLAAQRKPGSA